MPCGSLQSHVAQHVMNPGRLITALVQADADRAWYEGEAGRRQAALDAVEGQRQAEQAQRKALYQDLQAAAVLHHKEAQLLEHRSAHLPHLPYHTCHETDVLMHQTDKMTRHTDRHPADNAMHQ